MALLYKEIRPTLQEEASRPQGHIVDADRGTHVAEFCVDDMSLAHRMHLGWVEQCTV